MVDTDWREILSFSQRELKHDDKEKLCESLSWMEADDIELNFTDLKTLFKLSQDILKFKSEQVNNMLGQLETSQRKGQKNKVTQIESPSKSPDSALETIAHQEEVIKANKEILEQLYNDIAELEGRKNKLEDRNNVDRDSDSSRDVLSEMDAVAQLENEVTLKNRHIRKLLGDVKVLEEENIKLKEKLSIFKDKLTEATQLIENLTEQLFTLTNENNKLKEILGKSEQSKAIFSAEIESLRKELNEKDSNRYNVSQQIKSKLQYWKDTIRAKKTEIEILSNENAKLKSDLYNITKATSLSPKIKKNIVEEEKIKELQEKLSEASNEMMQSAIIIQKLRSENKQLKALAEDGLDSSILDVRNESDEGKERALINKLRNKNRNLTIALQAAEEMVAVREKELAEITAQLQLLKSDEGIDKLLEGLKNKKLQVKYKDDAIKALVKEVNVLNETLNELQLENETMRQKLNIPPNRNIQTKGIMNNYFEMEQDIMKLKKELKKKENNLLNTEVENRSLNYKVLKFKKLLKEMGYDDDKIEAICHSSEDEVMPDDGGGESSTVLEKRKNKQEKSCLDVYKLEEQIKELSEESEGLRKGLQEILDFLKDNSSTLPGQLALQCPSLDTVLRSMEARHAAGWFAPHMATMLELRTALGGKDALLTALNEARKETFDVMTQLSKESQKTLELEQKLQEIKDKDTNQQTPTELKDDIEEGEFGTWMSDKEQNDIDLFDKNDIETMIKNKNFIYENQLRNGLLYFHNKFKTLFDKMTTVVVQAADDKNRWSIQEEQYKAQIENLKAQLHQDNDEDNSDVSPGIVSVPSIIFLQRKCSYLEESYKYIRTLNENIKNEHLECKKDAMIAALNYEAQIQKLMLTVANLTDKLRYSVSVELFWKQNTLLNDMNLKYRKIIDQEFKNHNETKNFLKRFEDDKSDIIDNHRKNFMQVTEDENTVKTMLSNIEHSVLSKQLEQLLTELDNKNKQIKKLESKNFELQELQTKVIDDSLSSTTKEDVDLMKDQLGKLAEENKILKEQCQLIESELDIALLQLQDTQQRQLCNDLEINMLRHQVLDLQSAGDNKAIVARLSGEILVTHLQASEYQKKIERLNICCNKEKQLRFEAEEMLSARQKVFDVYASRYECKFRYMFEVLQVLRHQYQGNVPLLSVERYLNNIEEISRKNHEVNEKLDEIEDLRSSLIAKHSVFNQILDVSKNKCLEEEDSCQHKLEKIVMERIHSRELDHYKKKVDTLEQSREELLRRCNNLEKSLLHLNQGFEKPNLEIVMERRNSNIEPNSSSDLELEDVHSEDECSVKTNQTFTLPEPKLLKPAKSHDDMTTTRYRNSSTGKTVDVFIQANVESKKISKLVQTDDIEKPKKMKRQIDDLKKQLDRKTKELTEAMQLARQRTEELIVVNTEKLKHETTIQSLKVSNKQKDNFNERLQITIEELQKQIEYHKKSQAIQRSQYTQETNSEKDSLIETLKQLETDKNSIVKEYKTLLNNERNRFSESAKDMQMKINELQTLLERRGSEADAFNSDTLKEVATKYHLKVTELEDKFFKTQSELDGCKSELQTYQSELDRWKALASERLTKMEQLNTQLEERHLHEVESYKAENDHWMTQLNETQREHMELRTRLSEQKSTYMKQLAEKDAHIEQLRSVIHGLKTQIMNMQTMMSIADPSFDLSAIVEVEEGCDTMSHPGSERLELKFDSSVDLHDSNDLLKVPASSTAIWQEPIIERLRREKQLTGKQNAILRRQIKAIAARERRARLDAQNLRNQVYRISTSGSKAATAESSALHTKIASLHAQLTSARRETHSSVALWDKWKKAQQASERWRTRYEEKCGEVKKLESSLSLAKSTIERLQKDKRVLMTRLSEAKNESLFVMEKQDGEASEKSPRHRQVEREYDDVPVSSRALMDRIEAQQRRIVALEAAEKGNEYLVAEYEKSLAEVTSLKGQVLKLESTLLEAQIRSPMKHTHESQPELDYWKSYCEMLKEENVQLTLRVNSFETAPTTAHQHRVSDLEQTVLTLRGLVSKLQSEQKSARIPKHATAIDSRPSSSRSGGTEKTRSQLESYRLEIANLKRSIQDKDLLLERSKEMLKIAAEREDDLLRENASLRRQAQELMRPREGFLSA